MLFRSLNPDLIPVPPVPREGLEREDEILRRREELPEDLRDHPSFAVTSSHWDTWFTDEHDLRRRSFFGARRARGEARVPPPSPPRPARRGRAEPPPLWIGEPEAEEAADAQRRFCTSPPRRAWGRWRRVLGLTARAPCP